MYVRKKKDCEGPLLRNSTSSTVQCTCTVYMYRIAILRAGLQDSRAARAAHSSRRAGKSHFGKSTCGHRT